MTEHQIDPLVEAAYSLDRARITELLGKEPDQKAVQGALMAACWIACDQFKSCEKRTEIESIFRSLVAAGAAVNEPNEHGWLPLHEASGGDGTNVAAIETLLHLGADPHIQTPAGGTALHEAAFLSCIPEAISALLRTGIDPTVRNHDGQSALDLAKANLQHDLGPTMDRLMNKPLEQHIAGEVAWYQSLPHPSETIRDPEIPKLLATADWHRTRARQAEQELNVRGTIILLEDAEADWAKHHP